mgnify:CR=1 FL=1
MEVQNGICYQSINGLTKKNSTKMKIALLTIWHEKNYGAELQAYATIKAIKSKIQRKEQIYKKSRIIHEVV